MLIDRLRNVGRAARERLERRVAQPATTVAAAAARYWGDGTDPDWQRNSHWSEGLGSDFGRLGRISLAQAEQLVRVTDRDLPRGRTVEWGSGGGGQAVAFAPRSSEFIAVDISADSLDECERQVGLVCDTPLRKVHIPIDAPEDAIETIGRDSCDLFLCYYVLELVPSQEDGLRILDVAAQVMKPGAFAIIQIKYATDDKTTAPRLRAYERDLANMTTYAIDVFWNEAQTRGLQPQVVQLVPTDAFDVRYAYFLLVRR